MACEPTEILRKAYFFTHNHAVPRNGFIHWGIDLVVEKATLPKIEVTDIEHRVDALDLGKIARDWEQYGAFVVRGLMLPYAEQIREDLDAITDEAISQLHLAEYVDGVGWTTPNKSLFIPAPSNYVRDKQVMLVGCNYRTSAAFFKSACDDIMLSIVTTLLGDNVELYQEGQCLVKEPVGGHPKKLHQDSSYFQHKYDGPVAALCYAVDTDAQKGALYVVPGSHRLGVLDHVDTVSHLGLDEDEWSWRDAVQITGRAGDAIFFHVDTIHGSQENHSDSRRPVFIHRYRGADDYVVIGASTTKARKEAEKNIAQAKKDNQLGLLVSGRRSYDPGR